MIGKIDVSKLKIPPERHELETATFISERGYDVVFIPPNNSPNIHSPDIRMDGVEWEIKCPLGKSARTIENNFRKAIKQSHYIIFDLRHCNLPETQALAELKREFVARHAKRLLVILKEGTLIEYPEKSS